MGLFNSTSSKQTITEEAVRQALSAINDPDLRRDIVSLGFVKNIQITGTSVAVVIELTTPACPVKDQMKEEAEQALRKLGAEDVQIQMTSRVTSPTAARRASILPEVKNTIAVASGKGGVGKSSVAVNLAVALAQEGGRVGLIDADIYGPSAPLMFGLNGKQTYVYENTNGERKIAPLEAYGVKVISLGFLVDPDQAVIWRGPMAAGALKQLMTDVEWGELDYLIFDLPPGTGDIQLTLTQSIPLTGAVIVTTPQDIALIDARKGLKMFEKVGIPILGLVENMSIHICPQCGHEEHLFGRGGGEQMCRDYGTDLLGALPLEMSIRELTDAGQPTVVGAPQSRAAGIYRAIARRLAVKIAERARDMSAKFPSIVVQNT